MDKFTGFGSWAELLAYVESGAQVFYQAPLDYRPVAVDAVRTFRSDKVYVDPLPHSDADPFTADEGHLPRFKKEVQS